MLFDKEIAMAVRPIVLADNPALRKKSKKVKQFGEALQALIDDMVETMHAANGVGLAAPQIGVLERVIVIQLPEDEEEPQSSKLFALCNPQIIRAEGEEEGEEGCLCLPGYVGEVNRAASVTVKAQDRRGKRVRIKAEGFLARVFQHETDHLDGILYIDRVESPDKMRRIVPSEEVEQEKAPL
jgi:peptide deformylase